MGGSSVKCFEKCYIQSVHNHKVKASHWASCCIRGMDFILSVEHCYHSLQCKGKYFLFFYFLNMKHGKSIKINKQVKLKKLQYHTTPTPNACGKNCRPSQTTGASNLPLHPLMSPSATTSTTFLFVLRGGTQQEEQRKM